MIQVTNLQTFADMSFEQYLALPGYSYSGIKNDGVVRSEPSAKMQLGTQVHNCLLTPAHYSADSSGLVRNLANTLANKLGPLLAALVPELAITANMVHAGLGMLYKGRIDLAIPKRVIVDIKVSKEKNIASVIKYFGYDRQLSGYAIALSAPLILLLSIHPVTFQTQIINIPIVTDWWEFQIKRYGEPL